MRRPMKLFLKLFVSLLLLFAIAGVVYEQRGRRQDKERFPQIGRSVDIGGRSLNIHCSGDGSPTVVLENTLGYRWMPIAREVTKFTRACWYDQAGYGWSDPGPKPRTSAAVASDLQSLLRAAAVPPPYVLVGASGDGFPVRVFAGRHLNEVAGVVLVDAVHEDQYQREPRSSLGFANRLPGPVRSVLYTVAPAAGDVGLIRLMLGSTRAAIARRPVPRGMTADEAHYLYFLSTLPQSVVLQADEARNWKLSADEARNAHTLGDRPLIVLTAGKFDASGNPADIDEARAFHHMWVNELQPKLARLSSRGRQIIIEHSGHGIQFEAPDVLVGAIREIVEESRVERQR
jgi:pimeloyl-ACP methyl ester carboxylesterase